MPTRTAMIPVRPEAESEILRAEHILRVRIQSHRIGTFVAVSSRFQEREVELDLVLIGVLKGVVQEQPGDLITIRVTQTENVGLRITAVPGAYSRVDLTEGLEYIAFSEGAGTSAAQALLDPFCF